MSETDVLKLRIAVIGLIVKQAIETEDVEGLFALTVALNEFWHQVADAIHASWEAEKQ